MKTKKVQKKKAVKSKSDFFSFAKKTMSPANVKKAEAKAQVEIMNIRLAKLREALGITQSEVKGFTQSSISKLEGREDMKLSTLLEYLEAINMNVTILAYPKGKDEEEDQVELLKTGTGG